MPKTAVLLLTHFLEPYVVASFHRLRAEVPAGHDVFLLYNWGKNAMRVPENSGISDDAFYLLNNEKILGLPYPEKCKKEGWNGTGWTNIGNADTFLLAFHHDHPDYDFVWGVEYDVHYEGKWTFFFERFATSRADLLGVMLNRATKVPVPVQNIYPPIRDSNGQKPDIKNAVVGFFPLLRISRRLVKAADEEYRKGWTGHYELTLGTFAKMHGLEIEDFGGSGPYVKPHNKNAFYFNTIWRWDKSPGSFVFRPNIRRVLKKENTLWHPVKPEGDYFNHCPAPEGNSLYGVMKRMVKPAVYSTIIWLWFFIFWRPAKPNPFPSTARTQR